MGLFGYKPKHKSMILDEEDRHRLTQAQLAMYEKDIKHTIEKQTYLSKEAALTLSRGLVTYSQKVADYRAAPTPADKDRLGKEILRLEAKLDEQVRHGLSSRSGLSRATRKNLSSTLAEAILFGLFLFSLVLMRSGSGITGYTGYTIASLPVIVNWPFIFGLMIFILDLIAIERFYSK